MVLSKYIRNDISDKYEFYSYNHAIEIITQAFPEEWKDVCDTLATFSLSVDDLAEAGGSGTRIPEKFDSMLYPRKWRNVRITGDLSIKFYEKIVDQNKYEDFPAKESIISGFVSGQHVDYLKGRIAVDLEWNKKDISFDQSLTSFRTFYDCNLISVGVVVTRSNDMNEAFREILDSEGKSVLRKYGGSTTCMGRLLPRLDSRLAGGCPVLAIGIKKKCIKGFR